MSRGVSVQRGSLSKGGLCPEGSMSRGVYVQGFLSRAVSVQGESLSRGWSLSKDFSVQGGLCARGSLSRWSLSRDSLSRETPPGHRPPYTLTSWQYASYWTAFLLKSECTSSKFLLHSINTEQHQCKTKITL